MFICLCATKYLATKIDSTDQFISFINICPVVWTENIVEPNANYAQHHNTNQYSDWPTFVMCPSESESHLINIMQQHHVGDPQVFGRDGSVLQSVRVQQRHVLSIAQPHSSSFTDGQKLTWTLQV